MVKWIRTLTWVRYLRMDKIYLEEELKDNDNWARDINQIHIREFRRKDRMFIIGRIFDMKKYRQYNNIYVRRP